MTFLLFLLLASGFCLLRSHVDVPRAISILAAMTNRGVVESADPGTTASFARRRLLLLEIGLPLLVYALVAIPAAYRTAQAVNPDGVCYIRRAVYLAGSQYRWTDSVSGYWSPLFSWLIAPLIKLGVDGLIAAKLVLLFWGGVWVLTTGAFVRRICPTTPKLRIGSAVMLAIVGAVEAVSYVTPDIIFAACLFAYLTLAASPRLLTSRRLAFVAGLVAGIAYLAKSYGLPFFFAHAVFAIGYQFARHRWPWQRAILAGAAMFAGFFLLAAPWIAVLSVKYHAPTFSTAGPRAHAAVAPDWIPRGRRGGLPPDPFITMNEVPELEPYPFWSPFSSARNFKHQLAVIRDHLLNVKLVKGQYGMLGAILRLDALRLGAIAVAVAGVLAVRRLFGRQYRDQRHVLWALVTAAIYTTGFLLVFFEPRYVNSVFPPLALTLCLQLFSRFRPTPRQTARGGGLVRAVRNPVIVSTLVAISFGVTGATKAWYALHDQPLPIRKLARAVRAAGIHGPITTGPDNRTQGIAVAYMAEMKVMAFPPVGRHATPGVPPPLAAAHVDGILVFTSGGKTGSPPAPDAARDAAVAGGWTMASRVSLDRKRSAEIWVPPAIAKATTAPTTRRLRTK